VLAVFGFFLFAPRVRGGRVLDRATAVQQATEVAAQAVARDRDSAERPADNPDCST
jgi:hypothetical protein